MQEWLVKAAKRGGKTENCERPATSTTNQEREIRVQTAATAKLQRGNPRHLIKTKRRRRVREEGIARTQSTEIRAFRKENETGSILRKEGVGNSKISPSARLKEKKKKTAPCTTGRGGRNPQN